ncbi:CBN-NAS-23 protein [Aphelenchoides avenae]|nr:CBN-NAS-23 protein [Aphelenchus avenae]
MSRYDRDDWIKVQYDSLEEWKRAQFGKSTPERSTNLGVAYDYGSVMHYSAYSYDGKTMEVMAKRKEYQHTMGNFYGPVFKDLLMLNRFYKCTERCSTGAQCKNAGFRHPRDCQKCICPNGFGGADCSERQVSENGAQADCGSTLTATSEYQYLSGKVSSGKNIGRVTNPYYNIWRPKACHYHIRAPVGKRVELTVESVTGPCSPECSYGGTEVKFDNLTRVGARLCCESHLADVGAVKTTGELAIVSLLSGQGEHGFKLKYRLAEETAPSPPPSPSDPTRVPEIRDDCADRLGHCYQYGLICDDAKYNYGMRHQCARSCGYCRAPGDPVPAAGACVDVWPHCAMDTWKGWCDYGEKGHYANYGAFMKANCARTCGFCTDSKQ